MNDRAVALLEQYEIEVLRTRKGRGAILCDTQQGCLIFKEYTGREEQLRLQEQVLKHLEERGTVPAETARHQRWCTVGHGQGWCQIYSEDLVGRQRM